MAGVFKFIKDNFVNSPSADLTPEVMDMLMAVMLVSLQHKFVPLQTDSHSLKLLSCENLVIYQLEGNILLIALLIMNHMNVTAWLAVMFSRINGKVIDGIYKSEQSWERVNSRNTKVHSREEAYNIVDLNSPANWYSQWYLIKWLDKMSDFPLGFCSTGANFGRPLSDDWLLFAVLPSPLFIGKIIPLMIKIKGTW